jgi:hypothetical protein
MNMVEPTRFNGLRGTLSLHAPLAKHTTWRAGGGADIVYLPADRSLRAAGARGRPRPPARGWEQHADPRRGVRGA